MPQLDPYIFLHQILTLIFFFFLLYFYVRKTIIPKLNSILKYRNKKINKLLDHDKGNWKLYNKSNMYYSKVANIYLNKTTLALSFFLNNNLTNYINLIKKKNINNYFFFFNKYQKNLLLELKRIFFYVNK